MMNALQMCKVDSSIKCIISFDCVVNPRKAVNFAELHVTALNATNLSVGCHVTCAV